MLVSIVNSFLDSFKLLCGIDNSGRFPADFRQIASAYLLCPHQGCNITALVCREVVSVPGKIVTNDAGTKVLDSGSARDDRFKLIVSQYFGLNGIDDCIVHRHLILVVIAKLGMRAGLLVCPGHMPHQLGVRAKFLDLGNQCGKVWLIRVGHSR